METKYWKPELSNIHGNAIIGVDCIIHSHVVIYDDVVIGDGCKIQAFVFIPNGTTIGNNVFIGPRVTFTNDKNPPSNRLHWEETVIGDDVVIGAGVIILPGLTVGKGAIIGAGSVVTKNIPPGEKWVGTPAKEVEE